MPASFAKTVIVRKRYPVVDDLGNQRPNYDANPALEVISRCLVEPIESSLDDNGQLLTTTGYKIAAPFGADILARDLVEVHGVEYLAAGDAQQVTSPTGRLNQALVTVRRYERG